MTYYSFIDIVLCNYRCHRAIPILLIVAPRLIIPLLHPPNKILIGVSLFLSREGEEEKNGCF